MPTNYKGEFIPENISTMKKRQHGNYKVIRFTHAGNTYAITMKTNQQVLYNGSWHNVYCTQHKHINYINGRESTSKLYYIIINHGTLVKELACVDEDGKTTIIDY